jgi:hypothetical protein
MREALAVLDKKGLALLMQAPSDGSSVAIPDSRTLWEFIWEHRDEISGIAHTHPGSGIPGPSHEDLTTFRAVEKGLGRILDWWIVTTGWVTKYNYDPHEKQYMQEILRGVRHRYDEEPWVTEILEWSYREEKCHTKWSPPDRR